MIARDKPSIREVLLFRVKRALADNREGAEIKVSAFQLDACVMGSVALILRQVLSNPVVWYKRSNENPLEHPLALSAGVLWPVEL